MLWIPQKGRLLVQHNLGSVGDVTPGTTVTTGGTTSTKGTPAELIAATAFDAYWVVVTASGYSGSAAASDGAMDLLIGSATEEVLIPDMLFGQAPDLNSVPTAPRMWQFPLYIPAGSRLAVRAAGRRVSTNFQVGIVLYGGDGIPPFRVGRKVTTYGMGTVPAGTTITPGASGAEGSWTEIVASTTEDHFAFFPSFQVGNDTSMLLRCLSVDIGVGAATEQEIGGGYMYATGTTETMTGPFGHEWPIFADVPSGTRLVMRASCNGTLDSYNGVIHAVS